jgi:hypothetical protein
VVNLTDSYRLPMDGMVFLMGSLLWLQKRIEKANFKQQNINNKNIKPQTSNNLDATNRR